MENVNSIGIHKDNEEQWERMYSTSFFKSFLTTRIRGWLLRQNYDTINVDNYYKDYIQENLDRDPRKKVTEWDINDIINKLHNEAVLIKATWRSSTEHDFIISVLTEFLERNNATKAEIKTRKIKDRIDKVLKDIPMNPDRERIRLDAMESIPNLPWFEYFYYKKYTGKTVTKRVIENGTAIEREYTPVMAIWKKKDKPERFAGRLLMHFPIEPGNVDIHWSERLFHEKRTTTREEVDDTSTTEENWTIRKYELDHEVNQELQWGWFLYASGEECMKQEKIYLWEQRAEYERKKPEREFLESIEKFDSNISPELEPFVNPTINQYFDNDTFAKKNNLLRVPRLSHFFFRFPENPAYTPWKVRIFAVWNGNLEGEQPWHRGYMTIQWPIVDQANPLVIINEKENIRILPKEKMEIPNDTGKNLLFPFIQEVAVEGPQAWSESSAPKSWENTQAQSMEEWAPKVITESTNTKPISPNVIRNLASSSLNGAHISLDIDGYDKFIITPLGWVSNPTIEAFQQWYMPASIRWRKNGTTEDKSHIVRVNPNIDPQNPMLQIDPKYVKKQNVAENTWEEKLRVMDQETFRINQIWFIETKWKRAEDSEQREQVGRNVEIAQEISRGDARGSMDNAQNNGAQDWTQQSQKPKEQKQNQDNTKTPPKWETQWIISSVKTEAWKALGKLFGGMRKLLWI